MTLRTRQWLIQILFVLILLCGAAFFTHNFLENSSARGLKWGWDFLSSEAGFPISEVPLIDFDSNSTYGMAFVAGILNTLKVTLAAITLSTCAGVTLGIFRTGESPFLRNAVSTYVSVVRNVPLLLQLLLVYALVLNVLPDVPHSFRMGDIWLNNRGLFLPRPHLEGGHLMWELPEAVFGGRNLHGGWIFTPEFLSLTVGLSIYVTAIISELTRGGIESVPKGQQEAARALGLSRWQTVRLVVMPQAWRVILPSLISQFMNVAKNTSLAVAVGYPDVMQVGGTILNQIGRSVEVISLMMLFYLSFNILTSLMMNRVNKRLQIVER